MKKYLVCCLAFFLALSPFASIDTLAKTSHKQISSSMAPEDLSQLSFSAQFKKAKKDSVKLEIRVKQTSGPRHEVESTFVLSKIENEKIHQVASGELYTGIIKHQKKVKLSFNELEKGKYKLDLQAFMVISEDETWGARKNIYFTVTDNGVIEGW
ncbi:hypothetical protein T458_17605 [Brevibacillus panacihumi W25]|uniref:Uncharacterized protein n=1 Tax=Brevibacillus panacihumi W25 TaxID=1408254 RepID=V6M7H4_9BACL|nr:hypothetical protein [Brevibacillus panacihumi]EST53840.1 hypothetical protein T458_17605 [Brevibacillus panacihumi W25]